MCFNIFFQTAFAIFFWLFKLFMRMLISRERFNKSEPCFLGMHLKSYCKSNKTAWFCGQVCIVFCELCSLWELVEKLCMSLPEYSGQANVFYCSRRAMSWQPWLLITSKTSFASNVLHRHCLTSVLSIGISDIIVLPAVNDKIFFSKFLICNLCKWTLLIHAVFMCLPVKPLKLNISELVLKAQSCIYWWPLMYKLTWAQMHFKTHNFNSTENTGGGGREEAGGELCVW